MVILYRREGASCQYIDFSPWDERYKHTVMCWNDGDQFCWIVRERIPMWHLDGRRARADEVMAAFKTRKAAIEWIENEDEE